MNEAFDAVIIGAGASGLAAARALARRGRRAIVLEARSRAGGRIDTRVIPGSAVPAELGAEFIHGRPDVSFALMREASIGVVDCGEGQAQYRDNRLVPAQDRFGDVANLLGRVDRSGPDESVDAFLQRFAGDASLDETCEWTRRLAEGFDAVDCADASAQALAQEWNGDASAQQGQYRPFGGYAAAMHHLANGLDPPTTPLLLDTIVEHIEWDEGVRVHAVRYGRRVTFAARSAIVTVPLAVLQEERLLFTPQLPPEKRAALDLLAMGHVVKIVLHFDEAFWEERDEARDAAFFQSSGTTFRTFWATTPIRSTLLTAWAGGTQAKRLERLDRFERIEAALLAIDELFDAGIERLRRRLRAALHHDWQRDPWAGGAYSYARVGGMDARRALAAPLGPLHFAGEACAGHGEAGTVAGALQEGERAAREIP